MKADMVMSLNVNRFQSSLAKAYRGNHVNKYQNKFLTSSVPMSQKRVVLRYLDRKQIKCRKRTANRFPERAATMSQ